MLLRVSTVSLMVLAWTAVSSPRSSWELRKVPDWTANWRERARRTSASARCGRLLELVQAPSPERKKPRPMGPSLN